MSNVIQVVPCTPCAGGTAIAGTITGVVAGHSLVFVPGYYQSPSATPPAVPTDSNGTFTIGFRPTPANDGAGNNIGGAGYIELSAAAGTHVCSLALPAGGNSFGTGAIFEISNLASATVDQSNQTNTTSAIASSVSTGTLAQTTELAISVVATVTHTGVANAGISDPPSGFTSALAAQDTLTNIGVEIAYKEVSATTALTAAYTWTDANGGTGDTEVSQSVIFTLKMNSSGISGSGSPTDSADVSAGTGSAPIAGSGSPTDSADVSAGAGTTTAPAVQYLDASNRPRPGRGPFSKGRFYVSDTTAYTSAASAISGSGSPTDSPDVSSGTGSTKVSGTGTPSDSADISAGTGSTGVSGSGSPTDSSDASAGSGSTAVSGSGAPTDTADASSGTGSTAVAGSGSPTDQADVSAGTGLVGGAGSGSPTDQPDTSSGTGSTSVAGSGNPTDQADIAAGTGTTKVSGTGSPTDSADASSGAGAVGGAGSGSPVDPSDTSAGSGSTSVAGSGAPTDSQDASAGIGFAGDIPLLPIRRKFAARSRDSVRFLARR